MDVSHSATCSLESYCEQVPEQNRWKLDKQVDFEHNGVLTHLGAIADTIDQWEGRVSEALGLSTVDVSAIKTKHPDSLNLQARGALYLWQEKNGLEATYRNLIGVFLKADKTSYAEAVGKVLVDLKLESPSTTETVSHTSKVDDLTKKHILTTGNQEVPLKKSFEEEKKELCKENMARIKKAFSNLKLQVLRILKNVDIDMEEFIEFVAGLVPPKCVQDATDVPTVFKSITRNLLWSYIEYRPLKSIAEQFAEEDTKPLIESYESTLSHFYATTKLADYIDLCQNEEDMLVDPDEPLASNPARYSSEHYRKLTLKIGRRVTDETLQYVDDLWRDISKFFGLPSLVALLDHILEGSLIISWLIPHLFAMQIYVNCTGGEAEAFYRTHQIIEVMIDDERLYPFYIDTKFALLEACKEGNSDRVLELLKKVTDFDFSQYDDTPLIAAVRNVRSALDVVQVLLLFPVIDVNGRNKDGMTALMFASGYGRTDVVKTLLKHGADVNARMEAREIAQCIE